MRRILKSSFFLFLAMSICAWTNFIHAQPMRLGYDWVNPQHEYLKIKVGRTGIYRIYAPQLKLTEPVAPRNLRLWYRGEEQALYVFDQGNDGRFDGQDYFEFFGQRNDGWDDVELYREPVSGVFSARQHTNPFASIYTDTSAYFLMLNSTRSDAFTYTNEFNPDYMAYPLVQKFREDSVMFWLPGSGGSYYVSGGSRDDNFNHNSDFVGGEGYVGPNFNSTLNLTFPTPHKYQGNDATAPVLTYSLVSRSNPGGTGGQGMHRVRVAVGSSSKESAFWGYNLHRDTLILGLNDVNSGPNGTVVSFTVLPGPSSPPTHVPCWVRMQYDRTFNFSGAREKAFRFENNQNSILQLRIEGVSIQTGDEFFVFDLTNKKRIRGIRDGNRIFFAVPRFAGESRFYFSTSSAIRQISDSLIVKASLSYHSNPSAGAEFVIVTHRAFAASAQKYAEYRANNPYNRLSSKVVYMDELYDEFAYGAITPLAIKRFVWVANQRWQIKPKYVLLWGKATAFFRNSQGTATNWARVPTWGYPCSDLLLVTNYNPNGIQNEPLVPIGRINILNDAEGEAYLEKIKQYESSPFQPWMKHGLQLGGGTNLTEQSGIRSFMLTAKDIFETGTFSGRSFYFQKTNSDLISADTGVVVSQLINSGVNIVYIFGHSNTNVYDVEFGEATDYQNWGKYPFVMANGCYSGDYSTNTVTHGERFIKEPGRGGIGFMASSSEGYLHPLGMYSNLFYQVAYDDSVGSAIGSIQKETIKRYSPNGQAQINRMLNHARQINLQCDPSLALYSPKLPDLAINEPGIEFIPANPSTADNLIKFKIRVYNYGLKNKKAFTLGLKRYVQTTGETFNHPVATFQPFMGLDTVVDYEITVFGYGSRGLNRFEFKVDYNDEIAELNEENNVVVIEKVIRSQYPAIVYPWPFAVINKNQISLMASTYEVVRDNEPIYYYFEIDTSHKFNSPMFRQSGAVQGTSIEGSWPLPFALQDSTVYYWKVKISSASGGESLWENASFQYVVGPHEGWAQARPPQFFDDPTQTIRMDRNRMRWEFEDLKGEVSLSIGNQNSIIVNLAGNTYATLTQLNDVIASVGGTSMFYSVIDGVSLKPITYNFDLGYCDWIQVPGNMNQLVAAINNMKIGDYIAILATGPRINLWSENLKDALRSCGMSNQIFGLPPNDRFLFVGRKGMAPGTAWESIERIASGMRLNVTLFTKNPRGRIFSPQIGPGLEWVDYIWHWNGAETNGKDSVRTWVYGVGQNSQNQSIAGLANIGSGKYDFPEQAQQFDKLRLEAYAADPQSYTAPQLKHWYVLYKPAPEALIDPFTDYQFTGDIEQGMDLYLRLYARNISNIDMLKPLLIRYEWRTPKGETIFLDTVRRAVLLANSGYSFDYTISSISDKIKAYNIEGMNTLIVTINPDLEQPEQYYYNNIFYLSFNVRRDKINPILDVTFNGKHIVDGDIVTPNPNIRVMVNDENKFQIIDDSTSIVVSIFPADLPSLIRDGVRTLPYPGDNVNYRINNYTFTPAKGPENKAYIEFSPGKMENGNYILEANARDKSGNFAGNVVYRIGFKVINESTITDVVNYPNPFSTSTRFVYTLTGEEFPEVFQIHIYTITGKMVKVIDLIELGEVFTGQHITHYAWDGTDEYGDRLANGVYLYRVLLKMPGDQNIKRNDELTQKYFKKGWGKMVIMR